MTLGQSASRHNTKRGQDEAAKPPDSKTEHSSAEQSLRNVLDNSNKAAVKAGKSTKVAPDTTDKTTVTAPGRYVVFLG